MQDLYVISGHRHGRRAGFQRKLLHTNRIGGNRPSCLGLPPVVDHRYAKDLRGPRVGVRVQSLASLKQIAQRREVIATQVGPVGILLADHSDRGRGGEQHLDAVFGDDPPECARIGSAHRLTLVQHGRGTSEQRPVDDVGMADHPAHIGGRPEDIAGFDAIDVSHTPRQSHGVTTVIPDNAFGLAGGARGVEHIQRISGVHWYRIDWRGIRHHVHPVMVPAGGHLAAVPIALNDDAGARLMLC